MAAVKKGVSPRSGLKKGKAPPIKKNTMSTAKEIKAPGKSRGGKKMNVSKGLR